MPRTFSSTKDGADNFATEAKQDDIISSIQGSDGFPSTDIEGGGLLTVSLVATEIVFTGVSKNVLISAGDENLGRIYIGKSDVTTLGANAVTFLSAGESFEINYDDVTNPLYVVGSLANQEYVIGTTL